MCLCCKCLHKPFITKQINTPPWPDQSILHYFVKWFKILKKIYVVLISVHRYGDWTLSMVRISFTYNQNCVNTFHNKIFYKIVTKLKKHSWNLSFIDIYLWNINVRLWLNLIELCARVEGYKYTFTIKNCVRRCHIYSYIRFREPRTHQTHMRATHMVII